MSNYSTTNLGMSHRVREEFFRKKTAICTLRGKPLSNSQIMEILLICTEVMSSRDPSFLENIELKEVPRGRPKRPHVAYGDQRYITVDDIKKAEQYDRDQATRDPDRPDDTR